MATPYIGFGNESLTGPRLSVGGQIKCPRCGEPHEVIAPEEGPAVIMFFQCGETTYLAAVNGRSVIGQKPDVSGEI